MNFSQEDLFLHQQRLYTKDNCIIVIAGTISDIPELLELIGHKFGEIGEKKSREAIKYVRHLPENKEASFDKKSEQCHFEISGPGFAGGDDRIYAANILMTAFGGMMSSRLFQNIREKQGLCYYIGARHSSESYAGNFTIKAGIDKERLDFGIQKVYEEIAELVQYGITPEEFEKARNYRLGKLQM